MQTYKEAQIQIQDLKEAMEGRDPGGQNRQSESTGACRACKSTLSTCDLIEIIIFKVYLPLSQPYPHITVKNMIISNVLHHL